jgi:uncharacterized protein
MNKETLPDLQRRLGRLYMQQRIGLEMDHEARIRNQGINFRHAENWYSVHSLTQGALKLAGLYSRAHRNTECVRVKHNDFTFVRLPPSFDGFTILHISDLHADMNEGAMRQLIELLGGLRYDLCVLTGDYRGKTFGPYEAALAAIGGISACLHAPTYGVLGNHDTIQMLPGLEAMGIRMLVNEHDAIVRGDERIHLAGIDDAHYFRIHNFEKAASSIPDGGFSILLSHTPEVYRLAAYADFDLMLSGHTHGGQICLPGSIPITLRSRVPRRMGAGVWRYHDMVGYTSVGAGSCGIPVRLNCPPEIALHHLRGG